jgi:hypothetical protein
MNFARLSSSAIAVASLAACIARAGAEEHAASATPAPVPIRRPATNVPPAGLNLAPKVFNEFDPGDTGKTTQTIRGAAEFGVTLFGRYTRRFVEVEYQRFQYPHPATGSYAARPASCPSAGCVSVIGGNGSAYVNPSELTDSDIAIHSGIVGIGHTYLATSFLTHGNDYGYPNLESSFGLGLERLPDLSRPFTFYADGYYYPEVHGDFVASSGEGLELRYKVLTYEAGLVVTVPHSPLFLEIGDLGNRYIDKQNAPSSATHNALTLGLGTRF